MVKRLSAWAAELAWTVESVPECPVLRSCSKIERFPAANLSQDDAVGPVAEARPEELADGDGGQAAVRAPGFKAHQVGGAHLDLGGVLNHQDALILGDEVGEDAEERGLAGPGAARDQDVLAAEDGLDQQGRPLPG